MSLTLPGLPLINSSTLRYLRDKNLRIGILHSGGPAPGANRVIGGAAKRFLDHEIGVIGFLSGFEFLETMNPEELRVTQHFIEISNAAASKFIDRNATVIGTSRANPGKKIKNASDIDDPEKTKAIRHILDVFEWLRIGALITIGGDDTLKTANYIHQTALRLRAQDPNRNFLGVIHEPKTIDNDYFGIDFTFGFFTATEEAGRIIRGFYDDATATNAIHVVECMGRKAGWITAASSIFGRATYALIPEDFRGVEVIDIRELAHELVEKIVLPRENDKTDPKTHGIICLAEGLAEKLSPEIIQSLPKDRHGHPKLSEAQFGKRLAEALTDEYRSVTGRDKAFKPQVVGYETRQRPVGMYDALLTSALGIGAFDLIAQGLFGQMVSMRGQFETFGIPFGELIDPLTLKVNNRFVEPGSAFYNLLRALETAR